MFILGAGGFIGRRLVDEALAANWKVKALVRSAESAQQLTARGVEVVRGNAVSNRDWLHHLRASDVVVDLRQPKIPSRLTRGKIQEIARERQGQTHELLAALEQIPRHERPLLLSVSGIDDLAADANGNITSTAPIREELVGFSHIGVPVRRIVKQSGTDAAYVYLASVYGPGKTFADIIMPKIANGRWRVLGDGNNRAPLVHVDDVARALFHIAAKPRADVLQRTFVVADREPVSMREFFDHAARLIGARRPGRAPLWLGSLIAGQIMVETMTRDLVVDSTDLRASGFEFKYPTYREGLPATLAALGYTRDRSAATGTNAGLAFTVLALATFGLLAAENLLDFKLSVPSMLKSAGGLPLLDMRLSYSPTDAYHLLDILGETGRASYMQLLWSVDILIPALSTLFLWMAISRGPLKRLRPLALIGGAADIWKI